MYLCLVLFSCSERISSRFIDENDEEIISKLSDVTITKRGDVFLVEAKQFSPSKYIEIKKHESNFDLLSPSKLDSGLKSYCIERIKLIESLGFNGSSVEHRDQGISIKLYGEHENLIYCSDVTLVTSERWKKYLNSLDEIKPGWYLENR